MFFSFVIDVYSRRVVGWQFAATCAPTWSSTRCGWRSSAAGPAPTSSWSITPTRAANTPATTFTQVLDDHGVLRRSARSATPTTTRMAESFVDTFKTELIADRVWRTRDQLELAIVEYVAWFNDDRLHESLGDIPPAEFEAEHAPRFFSEVHSSI